MTTPDGRATASFTGTGGGLITVLLISQGFFGVLEWALT